MLINTAAALARGEMINFAIGLPCIRRTLAHDHGAGVATGMGAAAADASYGLLAALGMSVLATVLSVRVRLTHRLVTLALAVARGSRGHGSHG